MGEDGDDEEGAEHGHCADDEERLVAFVLPDDVGENAHWNGQAYRKSCHLVEI